MSAALTVDEYLDSTNYDFVGYLPREEALMFIDFIQKVNDGLEENETPLIHLKMIDNVFTKEHRVAILCFRGVGKLGTPDSLVLTPSGWSTMEKVSVGDAIITREGKTALIDYKTPLQNPDIYEIELSDGTVFEVGDEHNHIVWMYRQKSREKVLTTLDLLTKPLFVPFKTRKNNREPKGRYTYGIPLVEPIDFPYRDFEIPPYVMGYGLTNGYFKKSSFTCHEQDRIEIANNISMCGYTIINSINKINNTGYINIKGNIFSKYSQLQSRDKYIPKEYMIGSIYQRLELLRGLMDGDGHIAENGSCSYSSYSKKLAIGVRDVSRSLGAISYIKEYKNKNFIEYRVIINIKLNPFKLKRKANKWKPTKKLTRAIVDIRKIKNKGGYCIHIDDSTHSYITDGYTVTHNTSLFAEYLILFIAAYGYMPGFGKIDLMLYVSDSIENGVKNLRRNVEFRYANSDFLQRLIPNKKLTVGYGTGTRRVSLDDFDDTDGDIDNGGRKFTDIRLEFENYRGDKLVVKGYGSTTGIRGSKELGQRPSLVIFDDIVSDTDAQSPTIISTIENTVYKAASKALHPTRQKMIWLGTPFNESDPLYKAVESGAWKVSCFPIAEDFDSNTTKDNFKGAWEDRFPYEYVKREYDEAMKTGRPQDFYQELMLRVTSEEDRLIPESNFVWYSRDEVIKHKEDYNWYIFTDAATSESKNADYSVILIIAVNNNGDLLYVDGWHKKVLFNDFLNKLFTYVNIYKTNLIGVGVENSATQNGFISTIMDKQIRENNYFTLLSNKEEPGLYPLGNKFQRFLLIQPLFANHKIWFPRELKLDPTLLELINEIKGISRTNPNSKKLGKSRHDDACDALSQIGMINILIPSVGETVNPKREEDGIWYNDVNDEEIKDSYSMV